MKRIIVIAVLVAVALGALFTQTGLAALFVSRTQTITQEIVAPGEEPEPEEEPVKPPDPNRFIVAMRFGYDRTRYINKNNDTLKYGIEVDGVYNETQYMLVIPKDCVIERPTGKRLHSLFLREIDGNVLTFSASNVEFSKPCILYIAEGGQISQYYWTQEWVGDGKWVEVGSFTSIVDGEAHLD